MKQVVFLCCTPLLLCSQIFCKRTNTALLVKWYNQPLISTSGCTLLTPHQTVQVLPFQNTLTAELQPLATLCRKGESLEGLAALTVLLHTFTHPEMARYAGLYISLPPSTDMPTRVICRRDTLTQPLLLPQVPPAPNVTLTPLHNKSFMLQWQKIKGIYGYVVLAVTDSHTVYLTQRPLLDSSVHLSRALPATYFVKAIDVFGDTSLPSNRVTIAPAPPPVDSLKCTALHNALCLAWKANGYTQFEVQQRTDHDSVFLPCATLTANSYTHHPTRYALYHFRVRGLVNDSLKGPFSEIMVPYDDHDPPPPPQQPQCLPGTQGITVYWEPVMANDLCGYLLYRVLNDSVPVYIKQFTEPIRATTVQVAPSTSRWCVTAVDWKGNRSPCSAAVTCPWRTEVPPATPFVYAAQTDYHRIDVKWLPLTGASHVRIWLLPISNQRSEAVVVRTLPATFSAYSVFTKNENGLYRLWLEAVRADGKTSAPSNTVSIRLKKKA